MKKAITSETRFYHGFRTPLYMQLVELVVGLVLFAAVQNFWLALVSANPDVLPPSVPANLLLTGRSATAIDLAWEASSDDVAVTGYRVYRDGSLLASPTGLSYSDAAVAPSTSYTYRVSAVDALNNESAQSTPLSVNTLADTAPPSVPGNLRQTSETISSLTIAWNPSSDNVAVTGYNIFRNGFLIKSQAGTSFTDSGLAVYTGYVYNITARDAAGNTSGLSSSFVGSTAQDTSAPSVPDNLHQTASTVSSVTLSWDASSDDVSTTGYRLYRNGNLIASPAGTSFTDTGLSVSSTYTYTVLAFDAAANASSLSAPFTANSANDVTAPTTPANLRTTSLQDTSISLAWDLSSDDVAVVAYKVYRDGALIGTVSTTSFTDSGLTPVTEYTYTVRAVDAAANASPAGAALRATTAYDTTAPSAPANLAAGAKTDTSISLTWDPSSDNVAVSGYDIYRGSTLIATTTGLAYTDSGLSVFTNYTYKLRARDASNNVSAQSAPLTTATLTDTVLPAVPANLAAANITTTSIDISWDASSDDVAVARYKLYRDGALISTTTSLNYSDSARHYNTTYQYTVTAVDTSGNESPLSANLAVATLADTAAPQVSLTAPGPGNQQLTFGVGATASDDLELARVEFYADNTLIASLSSPPFSFNWNSYAVHNGGRLITAKAYDASGNSASQTVTINVVNPPPSLVADINGDHRINVFDLSLLLSRFNKSGSGDFNNNGRVDIFDLSVLLARFGQDNSNYQ